jgi:hypothetical protein
MKPGVIFCFSVHRDYIIPQFALNVKSFVICPPHRIHDHTRQAKGGNTYGNAGDSHRHIISQNLLVTICHHWVEEVVVTVVGGRERRGLAPGSVVR